MRYKFYREHKYVSFVLNDLERTIAKTDFRNPSEVKKIQEEFQSVVNLLKGHAQYENESLHELLRKKGSSVYEQVEADHIHYDEMLENLSILLQKVLESKNEEEQLESGYLFYLWFRKFVGDNLAHLHEEETVILPELQRLYTDEELKKIEAKTYKLMTPAEMIEMLEVLFPHMNPTDREAFLSDIKECEPEKFEEVFRTCSESKVLSIFGFF